MKFDLISVAPQWEPGTVSLEEGGIWFGNANAELIHANLPGGAVQQKIQLDSGKAITRSSGKEIRVLADYKSHVLAVDQTGQVVWKHRYMDRVKKMPLVLKNSVLLAVRGTGIESRNLQNGDLNWQLPCGSTGCSPRAIRLMEGRAYTAGFDQAIVAFEPSGGKIIWTDTVTGYLHAALGVGEGCIAAGFDRDYKEGMLICYDARKGTRNWSQELRYNGQYAPLVDGGQIFLGTNEPSMVALDQQNGNLLWETAVPKGTVATSPTAWQKWVVWGTQRRELLFLDRKSGQIEHRIKAAFGIGSPAVVREQLYVPLGNGQLMHFKP